MKKNFLPIAFAFSILILSSFVFSKKQNELQKNNTITTEEFSNFYYVVDSRYEGGSDAFIELFNKEVKYPMEAINNCRVGLSKIKFTISQKGKLEAVELSNPLGFDIDKTLNHFFELTKGNWKKWARTSEVEMTVGFRLPINMESYNPEADLVVSFQSGFNRSTATVGCRGDEKNIKKMQKYIKKKKYKKAKPYVEEMLRRFPDNEEFLEYKKLVE